MAAHRYWRLMCLYRNTSAACFSLTELEMFTASSPTTSVCTGGTPSASSVNSASWVAANAFDGVKTGDAGWASASVSSSAPNYPEWLMYDFGAGNEKEITSFAITSRSSGGGFPQTPLIFQMEWSDNGTDWVNDYLILTTGAWVSNDTRRFELVPIQTAPLIPHTLVAELPNVVFDIKYVPRGRGRLAGIARTDTAAIEGATVRVFDSATGLLIDTTKSNSVGAWQFDNLKEHTEHFITASHPLSSWENVTSSQRFPVDPSPMLLPRAFEGSGLNSRVSQIISLIHFDGSDDSTVFTDESSLIWTPYGNMKIKTTQSMFGGSSAYFDGGSSLGTATLNTLNLANDDFTIDLFVYFNSISGAPRVFQIGKDAQNRSNVFVSGGNITWFVNTGGSGSSITGPSVTTNKWYHLALSKTNSIIRAFVDGEMFAYSDRIPFSGASDLRLGFQQFGGIGPDFLNGYIDEFRFVRGYGKYSSNFTPPTAPFSILST